MNESVNVQTQAMLVNINIQSCERASLGAQMFFVIIIYFEIIQLHVLCKTQNFNVVL